MDRMNKEEKKTFKLNADEPTNNNDGWDGDFLNTFFFKKKEIWFWSIHMSVDITLHCIALLNFYFIPLSFSYYFDVWWVVGGGVVYWSTNQ